MSQIQKYKHQNIIQKELCSIIDILWVNKRTESYLNKKGIGLYTPKRTLVLRGVAVLLIGISFFIPFTTTPLIPFLKKVVLK